MKAVLLAVLLAIPGVSRADQVLTPPGGPVVMADDDGSGADYEPVNARPGPDGQGPRVRDPALRKQRMAALRAALMDQFDTNHDGRLGPRERMRALRVLRRLEARLAGQAGPGPGPGPGGPNPRMQQRRRAERMRRFIERYDTNGDGVVGPNEVPPRAANRFRKFDRNGDGWVDQDEFARPNARRPLQRPQQPAPPPPAREE